MSDETYDDRKMPLLDHLIELRNRMLWSIGALVVGFLICFYFAEPLFNFLVDPLADILQRRGLEQGYRRMIFTDLTEVFFTYIKVAFFFGAFITCPIFLTQFWLFLAPGLYRHEKKALAPFLVASPILFFMGGALVYWAIFPLAWEFFLSFETIRGRRQPADPARGQGERVSRPGDEADLRLRPVLPAAGGDDADGPVGLATPRACGASASTPSSACSWSRRSSPRRTRSARSRSRCRSSCSTRCRSGWPWITERKRAEAEAEVDREVNDE